MNYREKAEKCIEFTALPEMRRQFEECGCSLDAQYAKYGDTPYFHGEVVEPGHVYIVGYPCCVCPEAANGEISDPNFCECSRQSVLYVLETCSRAGKSRSEPSTPRSLAAKTAAFWSRSSEESRLPIREAALL